MSQRVVRLVARESTLGCGRALHQNPARAAAIDRVEIVAILDFGAIGVAELFVKAFLLGKSFVGPGIQRDVMAGARAESPASRRTVRLMQQNDSLIRPAAVQFQAMIIALHAGLLESQRFDEKPLGLWNFANR